MHRGQDALDRGLVALVDPEQQHLGHAAQRGQRRAQLVRRVRDEPALASALASSRSTIVSNATPSRPISVRSSGVADPHVAIAGADPLGRVHDRSSGRSSDAGERQPQQRCRAGWPRAGRRRARSAAAPARCRRPRASWPRPSRRAGRRRRTGSPPRSAGRAAIAPRRSVGRRAPRRRPRRSRRRSATGHGGTSGTGDDATIVLPSGHITTTEVSRPEISETRFRADASDVAPARVPDRSRRRLRVPGQRLARRARGSRSRSTDVRGPRADVVEQERLEAAVQREAEDGHDRGDQRDVRDRELPPDRDAGERSPRRGASATERVPDAADRADQRPVAVAELLAQGADVGLDDVAVAVVLVAPDPVEDRLPREDLARDGR